MAQLARQVAGQIKQWIGRVTLPGHAEAVKAGDIMILLPRREPFGSAIIRELKLRGVPVAGADRIRADRADRGDGFDRAGPLCPAAGRRSHPGGAAALAIVRRERGGVVRAGAWPRKAVLEQPCSGERRKRPPSVPRMPSSPTCWSAPTMPRLSNFIPTP